MSFDITPLIQPNTITLTANSRLSRTLLEQTNKHYLSVGAQTWETPNILPLTSWLTQQFYQHNEEGFILLTDAQEDSVWEKIITESDVTPTLLHPSELARLVKDAHSILYLWEIPLSTLEPFQAQLEVKCMLTWIQHFEKLCSQKNWITQAKLPQYLFTHLQKKSTELPRTLLLSGFDTFNPALEKLLSLLKEHIAINRYEPKAEKTKAERIIAENTEAELTAMAKWLKAQWLKNPNAKLGCIIPELSKLRKSVNRIMTSVFCIENILPTSEIKHPPFNISAGAPLAEQAMIHAALKVLTWCNQALPIEEIAYLLQSPYLSHDETDKSEGAKIDAILRQQNRLFVSLSDLFYSENKSVNRWRSLLTHAKEIKNLIQQPSEWANHFIDLLKTIRWPGSTSQTSEAYQLLERFKKLIKSFAQFDLIYEKIDYAQALTLLKTLSHKTVFQPKSHNEPIQIMGALESSGIVFDAVWILGLHDGIWPAPSKPNPLIPYTIQQQYQTPHATSARELQFCEQVTKRFEQTAKHIIFSTPKKQNDQHLSSSQLIEHIPLINLDELELDKTEDYAKQIFNSAKMENIEHDNPTPLTEFSQIQGGSAILKSQALCPFKAFAESRLKARALNTPEMGVTHLLRGVITHQILFELWNTLKSQEKLHELSDEALKEIIDDKITKTFSDKLFQIPISENKVFFEIEKKRLQVVIFNWMQVEKSRPPFQIHALETSSQITVNQLPINIRLDRIDELSDGSLALIDYKTGRNSISAILKETLTDPQLPIYAVFHNRNRSFETIAFAGINQSNMGFSGISHENKNNNRNEFWHIETIRERKNELHIDNWNALTAQWEKSLNKLADDFCRGDAQVKPIDQSTCEQCGLQRLCRKT